MESMCMEHQSDDFLTGQVYLSWQEGELWNSLIESCGLEPSNTFHDGSPHSPLKGRMPRMDDSEHQSNSHNLSPLTPSHPVEELEIAKSKLIGTQNQSNDSTIVKHKPEEAGSAAKPININNLSSKRTCPSRSIPSASATFNSLTWKLDIAKGDALLERNRIASNKFRERKRHEVTQLESEYYTIKEANLHLRGTLKALTNEILSLKMQLLQHADCSCELIQAYIIREATLFVESLGDFC